MYSKSKIFKCLLKNTKTKPLSLRQFAQNRNKIYVRRRTGGLGDIIMHRMLFEDFKALVPSAEITFGCPRAYAKVMENHPFVDHIVDCDTTEANNYGICYDTTTRCRVYEAIHAPFCMEHRSDIWAQSCGVTLENHHFHLNISEDIIARRRQEIDLGSTKKVLFVPWSSNGSEKNLSLQQVKAVIQGLITRGYFVYGLHQETQPYFNEFGAKTVVTNDLQTWTEYIAAADYVITIDTAAFHMAGGLKKPMVGIFGWTNGKIYGKHFDFILVQKHRDDNPEWCGPCGNWGTCPKNVNNGLPCATEVPAYEILDGFDRLVGKNKILAII